MPGYVGCASSTPFRLPLPGDVRSSWTSGGYRGTWATQSCHIPSRFLKGPTRRGVGPVTAAGRVAGLQQSSVEVAERGAAEASRRSSPAGTEDEMADTFRVVIDVEKIRSNLWTREQARLTEAEI